MRHRIKVLASVLATAIVSSSCGSSASLSSGDQKKKAVAKPAPRVEATQEAEDPDESDGEESAAASEPDQPKKTKVEIEAEVLQELPVKIKDPSIAAVVPDDEPTQEAEPPPDPKACKAIPPTARLTEGVRPKGGANITFDVSLKGAPGIKIAALNEDIGRTDCGYEGGTIVYRVNPHLKAVALQDGGSGWNFVEHATYCDPVAAKPEPGLERFTILSSAFADGASSPVGPGTPFDQADFAAGYYYSITVLKEGAYENCYFDRDGRSVGEAAAQAKTFSFSP